MIFDHLVVGGKTLEEAQAHIEDALGLPMQPGGAHTVFHTHNAVMGLEGGLYLEAIAPDPAKSQPDRPRWFDLDRFAGPARLSNWACSVESLDTDLPDMPAGFGPPVSVARDALNWRMAIGQDGTTPFDNLWPALVEWPAGMNPAKRLTPRGATLKLVTLIHPDADRLRRELARHLDDLRVVVETGSVGMRALFDTPHGERSL